MVIKASRYGFNGKMKDNEVEGEGDVYDYGKRMYDVRLGRFLSIDPLFKKYQELSPYQYGSNRPIDGTDLNGLEWLGCTTFISLNVTTVAGIGYGGKLAIETRTAYDMIGTTQYISSSVLGPNNQDLKEATMNPQVFAGAEASGNAGVMVVHKSTFEKAFDQVSLSIGTVSAKAGLGGSVTINPSGFGVSVGYGIGGHFESGNNSTLIQSISIATEERKNVTTGSVWIVGPKEAIYNKAGEITGYSAKLLESSNNGEYKRETGLTVYSDVQKTNTTEGGKGKTEYSAKGNWKTEKYKSAEKKENAKK